MSYAPSCWLLFTSLIVVEGGDSGGISGQVRPRSGATKGTKTKNVTTRAQRLRDQLRVGLRRLTVRLERKSTRVDTRALSLISPEHWVPRSRKFYTFFQKSHCFTMCCLSQSYQAMHARHLLILCSSIDFLIHQHHGIL